RLRKTVAATPHCYTDLAYRTKSIDFVDRQSHYFDYEIYSHMMNAKFDADTGAVCDLHNEKNAKRFLPFVRYYVDQACHGVAVGTSIISTGVELSDDGGNSWKVR